MSVILLVTNVICPFIPQFPSFRWLSTRSEKSRISRIFDSKLCYFSSDLKFVNIRQIETNQIMEMESNTSTLRFREQNVQIGLISRATLENITAKLDLVPLTFLIFLRIRRFLFVLYLFFEFWVKSWIVKIQKNSDFQQTFCNNVLSQGDETRKERPNTLILSKISLGGVIWFPLKSNSTRNFLQIIQNLMVCFWCTLCRRENEILRRSKRRWKVQNLFFCNNGRSNSRE